MFTSINRLLGALCFFFVENELCRIGILSNPFLSNRDFVENELCWIGILSNPFLSNRDFVENELCRIGILAKMNFVELTFCRTGFCPKPVCRTGFCRTDGLPWPSRPKYDQLGPGEQVWDYVWPSWPKWTSWVKTGATHFTEFPEKKSEMWPAGSGEQIWDHVWPSWPNCDQLGQSDQNQLLTFQSIPEGTHFFM